MGHSSIQITVDLWASGHLIPGSNNQAVDQFDAPALFESKSATPAQPAPLVVAPASSDRAEYPGVYDEKGWGE